MAIEPKEVESIFRDDRIGMWTDSLVCLRTTSADTVYEIELLGRVITFSDDTGSKTVRLAKWTRHMLDEHDKEGRHYIGLSTEGRLRLEFFNLIQVTDTRHVEHPLTPVEVSDVLDEKGELVTLVTAWNALRV